MQLLALICAVQICCLLPTKPLPPPHQSPSSLCEVVAMTICLLLSHIWSKERERLQHYASDMLWLLWETQFEGEGGGRKCIQYIRTFLQIQEGREIKSSRFKTPTLDISAGSPQNTERLVVPDQNTGKIVAYFTAGNNKMLFIHKGTKNLLETSFTAEKTRLHKLLSKIIPYSSAIDCPIFVMLLVIEWAGWGQCIWDWGDRSCFM